MYVKEKEWKKVILRIRETEQLKKKTIFKCEKGIEV